MVTERQVKPLKYKSLPGLSEKQLSEHHSVLYAGYVKKINEINLKMETAAPADANATFSLIRELKLEETFALNAIKLHEGYFDNMGGDGQAKGTIKDQIAKDFDSFEKWEEQFRAMGIAARGWVVLAYDLDDGKLHNYLCDVHNQGGVWGAIPILILDVYEHAYFLDYGTGRKAYIEAFMKTIEWKEVDNRYQKVKGWKV